jgi:hypothetical protein
MNLEDIAAGRVNPISLSTVGDEKALARQVQDRLTAAGLLEPPSDGDFGPVSHWALGEFLRKVGMPSKRILDQSAAQALLSQTIGGLFPLNNSGTLAGRIAAAIGRYGWWITRHPDCVNVVYVEGLDADGTINDDAPNIFNDLRLVLRVNRSGNPEIAGCWEATSEPGTYFTKLKKEDRRGAARIAFGQYKSWSVGMHPRSNPSVAHEALVQVKDITVCRDLNEDYERTGDATFTGLFGINQHWGYNLPRNDIRNASAGCLVGRTKGGHQEFMALVKADPRYGANRGVRFMTAVMPASETAQNAS